MVYYCKVESQKKLTEKFEKLVSNFRYLKSNNFKNIDRKNTSLLAELLSNYVLFKNGLDYKSLKFENNGKPFLLNEKYISISHSGEYVAVALEDKPVGVDIQILSKYNPKIVNKICSNNEINFIENSFNKDLSFTIIWSLKEAYIKASNSNISHLKETNYNIENGKILSNLDYDFSYYSINNYILAKCKKK